MTHNPIETVWRIEAPRLIAGLARFVRDLDLAEELAQDALVAALETWPRDGVPDNPGAWLMATGKNRALDRLRRTKMQERKQPDLQEELQPPARDLEQAIDEDVGDDLLRLILVACHPVLNTDARAALTLRLLGGLSSEEIARAFLQPETTIAQRIVRAKKTLAQKQVAFEVPRGAALQERLESVLEVIYLIFNEGYAATAGEAWMRPALCEDALRLGRVLVGLVPEEAEAHALVALMELQASRTAARTGPDDEPILLLEQNRALWDQLLIQRGLAALDRAVALGGAQRSYALQAAIAACHARARVAEDTDWVKIAALYEVLAQVTPSPVVELNRAVAVSMAFGPAAGLALVDALANVRELSVYHLLPAVRGDLLSKLGRHEEARAAFERAAALTNNTKERAVLRSRARRD